MLMVVKVAVGSNPTIHRDFELTITLLYLYDI